MMILFFYKGFSKVTFFANEMVILSVDLDKFNLGGDNSSYNEFWQFFLHDFFRPKYSNTPRPKFIKIPGPILPKTIHEDLDI